MFSLIKEDGRLAEAAPAIGELGDWILAALEAVDALQSGTFMDVLGEADMLFRDRFGSSDGPTPERQAPRRHDPKLRLRIRGAEKLLAGAEERLRVGLVVKDRVGSGPLRGWDAEAGAEAYPFGKGVRGFVGLSRPWPNPHESSRANGLPPPRSAGSR